MLVEVALPVPLPRTFTYGVDAPVAPGTRVRVRFGPRRMLGWVMGETAGEPPPRLRPVEAVLDQEPTVPPDLLRLCRWIADYYLCPIGQVLKTALPAVLSHTAREEPHVRTRRVLRLSRELPSLVSRDEAFGRARRQRECYEFLEATGGWAEIAHLTEKLGFSDTVVRGLVQRGLASVEEEALDRDPFASLPVVPPADLVPTPAQAAAIEALVAAAGRARALSRGTADATTPRRDDATSPGAELSRGTAEGGIAGGREGATRTSAGSRTPAGTCPAASDGTPRWPVPPSRSPALSPSAVEPAALASAPVPDEPPRPFLLRGVTGSGKTLVYIELLKEVVGRQGRGAIVLVPEIALTPQTVARFRSHFGDAVAVLHSALSDGERYDAWRALRRGEKRIAVGARSAVFAPIPDLGAIVLDEEHEGSYKQAEAPRYHAREVAIVRARLTGAVCVLGSATPSLESWHNASRGKFSLLELPERVEGRPLPPVRVIDTRQRPDADRGYPGPGASRAPVPARAATPSDAWLRERERVREGDASRFVVPSSESGTVRAVGDAGSSPQEGVGSSVPVSPSTARPSRADRVLSEPLIDAIDSRLRRGEQTILLLNRRGYSTFVQCRDCGAVRHCRNCNVSLTYHRAHRRMVCHYCFHEEPPPVTCDACGSGDLSFRGVGTEQVERSVAETFPAARLARMDVDTTSGKWSHHEILSRVERGDVDILLGTQMIAKGLDFPRVTLVGVINADVGMNLPDFRASERTFQLLTQVSGRAGRGELGGEVLVQTALPGHYAVRAALQHDFVGFAARELEERLGPGYPPHTRLLNVVVSGTEEEAVQLAAAEAADWTSAALPTLSRPPAVALVGPAPCAVDRIRNRWRWHFLLRSRSARQLAAAGRLLHHRYRLRPGPAELRLVLDRDPVSLL